MLYYYAVAGLQAGFQPHCSGTWQNGHLSQYFAGVNIPDANASELQAAVVGRNPSSCRRAIVYRGLPRVRRQPGAISFRQHGSALTNRLLDHG